MKVVIVGGGFAGVRAARNLANNPYFKVTLISDRYTWEYHAALYRTTTGGSSLAVKVPLAEIFDGARNIHIVLASVQKIHSGQRYVLSSNGEQYHYDKLIMAVGNKTAYFGIKGLERFSYGIKSVDEALRLRSHLHAELTGGPKMDLNYVIVGAGPTGVELAAEMVYYLRTLRRRYFVEHKNFHIILVEAAPRILPTLPEDFARTIHKRLRKLGVKIYTSTAVQAESADEITLPEGSIKTHTVVWTAGVTTNPVYVNHPKLFKLGKGGRVMVDHELQSCDHIYVLGDSALTTYSGWAQTALYDADYVTGNLGRQVRSHSIGAYAPIKPIAAIPVGPAYCAVETERLQLFGYGGWLVRRALDLHMYLKVLPFGLAMRSFFRGSSQDD
jgi:NADH:ubiquinone reductase (H+-translocating)